MTEPADHVLLTRFNLPSAGAESIVRATDGWLRLRMDLFERYCLPSVGQQSVQSFKWIIYFDPLSPDWLVQRIIQLQNSAPFTPIYRTSVSHAQLMADLRGVTGATHTDLITTNLDNDDGLARDFMERLQNAIVGPDRVALYFVRGLIRCGSRLYLQTDRTNAFVSVREHWDTARTCWADWHNLLPKSMNTCELSGGAAWLQMVHGTNVSNRIRGQRVAPLPYLETFGQLLEGVEDPRNMDLIRDLTVDRPLRFARESGRAVLKETTLRVVGREGLDQLKESWATRLAKRR